MFTGIVQGVGRIEAAEPQAEGLRLRVEAAAIAPQTLAIGDSVAVNGCCLTVVARDARTLAFDGSNETLRCTAGLASGGPVNLEKALRVGDPLGGHLMTGHVDGVGEVDSLVAVVDDPPAPVTDAAWAAHAGADARAPVSRTLTVTAPAALARFIAVKGSIAVQGVSLTVNAVAGARFSVNLIPHTLVVTTLGRLRAGDRVNLEVDLLARYVARLAEAGAGPLA
jgi:riboflavin synthase